MPSLRSNAPSSPGFLQWSAALRIRRFSALENCRRLAVAATSGSGAVEAADAAAAVALRAPCAAASAGSPATPCGNDPFNKLLMRYLPLLSKFAKGGVSHHIGTGGSGASASNGTSTIERKRLNMTHILGVQVRERKHYQAIVAVRQSPKQVHSRLLQAPR